MSWGDLFDNWLKQTLYVPGGHCPVCRRVLFQKERWVCPLCESELKTIDGHVCRRCGRPLFKHEGESCGRCSDEQPFYYDGGYGHWLYREGAAKIIQRFKFYNEKELAYWVGQELAKGWLQKYPTIRIDLILPVPLHPNRLKERGYNQSEWLCKGMLSTMQLPQTSLNTKVLVRVKDTAHQPGKGRQARIENVRDAFRVVDVQAIQDKNILVIDDVLTTGATLRACGALLKEKGAKELYSCVAAID